jgi:hypothetical protein
MKNSKLLLPALVDAAHQRTALHDFGKEDFKTPLQTLLTSLNEEANLNNLGHSLQFDRITELLANRLRLQHFITHHPEILEEQILSPIVIAGLPRTGTTMLQRTLSMEPSLLGTRWYEMRFPVPAFDWDFSPEHDERIARAKAEVSALVASNPELLSMHPLDAMQADEDILLLENTFLSVIPGSQANVPSYNRFFETFDTTDAYRYHKKMLQFIQWQRRRSGEEVDGKPWVLKSPAHMHEIAALFAVYPDARMVMSHRDPVACMPSISSLYFGVWKVYSDSADPVVCGRYCQAFYALALRRAQEQRDKVPGQFFDIQYRRMVDEPDAVIAELFDFIGVPLLPQSLSAMQQWRESNRRSEREIHSYRLADFGFDEAGVREAFADYYASQSFLVSRDQSRL